jgi:uncharacterized protein (TIGR02466 family)
MALIDTFNEAVRLYQAGDYEAAEALCAQARHATAPGHADVLRLSGMVARKGGRLADAENYLQRALKLAPQHYETLNVIGLLRLDTDRSAEAAQLFETALQAKPGYAPAVLNLVRAWIESERADEAVALVEAMTRAGHASLEMTTAYGRALYAAGQVDRAIATLIELLDHTPGHVPARKALVEMHLAEGRSDAALASLPADSEDADLSWARIQALFRSQAYEEALAEGRRLVARSPGHLDALKSCAQILWMTDRGDEIIPVFEGVIQAGAGSERFYMQYIKTLTQMDQTGMALKVGERAIAEHGRSAGIDFLLADALIEMGDGEAALEPAASAAAQAGADIGLLANHARALLMTGKGAESLPMIRRARAAVPHDQFWIAMEASACRLVGDPSYEWLAQYDKFVRPQTLAAPDGFDTIEAFNAVLLEKLMDLHQFDQHPLDQSLRLGSQTSMDLKNSDDPLFQAFFKSLSASIETYIDALGDDVDHPFLSRKRDGFKLTGAWSVKLGAGGSHVSHVHPEGWISSAYYVTVPEAVTGAVDREGWINFGAPPFAIPGADAPEHFIEPKAGCLALFPSYMWHGTVPIRSGQRVTIAFDVVPE